MGRIVNDITQKLLPMAKKRIKIRFRRKNGRWLEFDVSPGKETFHFARSEAVYQITGIPDVEDATGQREYMFFEGVPYPIKSHTQHPELLVMGREAGNQQIMLTQAEERGLQKALLLKGGKKIDLMMYMLIAVAINLIVTVAMACTIFSG